MALGPGILFFSNVMALITLSAVRVMGSGFSPNAGAGLLACGNLACALLLAFPRLTGRPLVPRSGTSFFWIVFWGICYSINYGTYSLYPTFVGLSDLIIAQSLAPTSAVLISGDWRRAEAPRRQMLNSLVAICLLIAIALIRQDHVINPFAMLLAFTCTLGTNLAGRKITHQGSPLWGQARVASVNSLLLIALIYVAPDIQTPAISFSFVLQGVLLGMGVLLTQGSFLLGIRKSPPFLGALILSTSVPLSLLAEAAFRVRPISLSEIVLALLYCLHIWLGQRVLLCKTTHTRLENSRSQVQDCSS